MNSTNHPPVCPRGRRARPVMDFDDTVVIRQLAAPAKCNVLVVEDDKLVRAQIGSLLRLAGYLVYCAASGTQALLILGERPCEIVLTDWEMPDMAPVTIGSERGSLSRGG